MKRCWSKFNVRWKAGVLAFRWLNWPNWMAPKYLCNLYMYIIIYLCLTDKYPVDQYILHWITGCFFLYSTLVDSVYWFGSKFLSFCLMFYSVIFFLILIHCFTPHEMSIVWLFFFTLFYTIFLVYTDVSFKLDKGSSFHIYSWI